MNLEIIVFIVYLVFMLGIGVSFFLKSKGGGEKVSQKRYEEKAGDCAVS